MLLKVYKSRVWLILLMLLPFVGSAQIPGSPWSFTNNPNSAVYAIPTTVAYNGGLTALSAGDWVGAFYDDGGVLECGGAYQWTGTANIAVVAFGNDTLNPNKNGFWEGETVQWKFFYSATSSEVDVLSTPEFTWSNGAISGVTEFHAATTPEITQTINASAGWNWISFNVLPEGGILNDVLGDTGYTEGDFIQTPGGTADYYEGFGWYSEVMPSIDPDKFYQLRIANPKTIIVTGNAVDVADPINVFAGWNWIGYKPQGALELNTALASISPSEGDFLQTPGGTADYYDGFGWYSETIPDMIPGKGYQMRLTNSDVLVYPQSKKGNTSTRTQNSDISSVNFQHNSVLNPPEWPAIPIFPFYQSARYRIYLNGNPIETPGSMLSAWKDGEIRGKINGSKPAIPPGSPFQFNIQMGSELPTEPGFTFLVYDAGTDKIYEIVETHNFVSGVNLGTATNPLTLTAIASSQTIDICGTVVNSNTLAPISGALITASTGGGGTVGLPTWPAIPIFPFYQSARYRIYLNGNPIETPGSMLSAWKDGEIRGKINGSKPAIPPGSPFQFNIQMGSELPAEPGFTFLVYDAGTNMVYEIVEGHDFVSGQNLGTATNPLIINVLAGGVTLETTTGADGTYCFTDVESGTYTIGAEAEGYFGQEVEDVLVEASITQDFALVPIVTCQDVVINNFPAAPADVCFGESVVIDFNDVEILNAVEVGWYVDPMTAGAFLENLVFTLDPDYTGVVTITVHGYADSPCEDAEMSLSFEVFPLPLVTLTPFEPVCEGSDAFGLSGGMPLGGTYYVSGVAMNGFNPTIAGTFEVEYVYTDANGCTGSAITSIVVNPLPVAECPEYAPVCAGSDEIVFPAVAGGYYIDSESNEITSFDPTEAGTFQFALMMTNEFGCESYCVFEIVVLESAVVYAGANATILVGETYTIADATVLNTEIIVWTTYGDGTFDDNTIINPTYTPGVADIAAGQVTLSLLGGGTCPDVDTMVLFIGEVVCPNPAVADAGEDMIVCADGEAIQLEGFVENADLYFWSTATGMGEFSNLNILNPTYTPGEGDYLMGSVELCLTAVGLEGCPDAVDCMTITFNALPVVTLVAYAPVCEGSVEFDLYGGLPEGGVYFVDGVEASTFNPAMAGEYDVTYTFTDVNGCSNSAMGTIVVNPLPVANCPEFDAVCAGSEMIDFDAELGVYTNVEGLEVTGFDPAMAGTYMFTLTVTNEFGCEASCEFSIVVNPLPVVECPVFAPVCAGSEMIAFDLVEGGVYTNDAGDVVTGFDPALAGDYDFTLTVTNEFGCEAMCEFSIFVAEIPVAECPEIEPVCAGSGMIDFEAVVGGVYTDAGANVVTGFEPTVAGTFEFTLTVTSEFGCSDFCTFQIVVLPLPEITTQPVDVTVVYGQPFELTVVADANATGYQWYFEGAMIAGATTDTYFVASAMPADGGTYYVVVSGECGDVTSDEVTVTITPETQIIDFLGAVNGMSTYLQLIEDDMATILGPVLSDVYYVELKTPVMVWTPSNTSFAFNEDRGAKVVLNGGFPTSVEVTGYPTLGTLVNLPAGASYLPVHSRNVVSAADVFGPLGASLYAVYSMDYSGIYWPDYGVYTLQNLVPGSAYLIVMNSPAVADFDVPSVKASVAGYTNVPTNLTSWNNMVLTATQHNIAITANALSGLQIGDVIGAFNEFGQIAGMVEVTSLRDNLVLRAFGDNPATEAVEGFVEGDMITFKVWRNGVEIAAEATFTANMPNQNVFAKDGISAVEGLKAGVTAINDLSTELTANLYPNPATSVVNINTNFVISNVKVINYVGQVIFETNPAQEGFQINTSNLVSGMYFVQIESNEGYVITKRLTIK